MYQERKYRDYHDIIVFISFTVFLLTSGGHVLRSINSVYVFLLNDEILLLIFYLYEHGVDHP